MLVSRAVAEAAALADVDKGMPFRTAAGGGVDDTAGVCTVDDDGGMAALRFREGAEDTPLEAEGVASLADAAGALLLLPLVAFETGVGSDTPLEDDSAAFFFAVDDISKSISWSSA